MIVDIKYIASSGNEYNLQANNILTRVANYHAWEWSSVGTALQYGTRVSAFTKAPAVYTTQLVFRGPVGQRKTAIDALHEDFELDIRNMSPGKIIWGDYYIQGYITASSTAPDANFSWTDNDITIYCPYPFWIKEDTRQFMPQSAPVGETFLDYDYDYDYDFYYGDAGIAVWQTGFPFSSEFKLTIYGAASDPRILINNHPYQVNDDLGVEEYIIIDSRANSVTKYTANGTAVNIFDKRDKVESVFEPIPPGSLHFTWSGVFGFDLTLYEERSEPRWNT